MKRRVVAGAVVGYELASAGCSFRQTRLKRSCAADCDDSIVVLSVAGMKFFWCFSFVGFRGLRFL